MGIRAAAWRGLTIGTVCTVYALAQQAVNPASTKTAEQNKAPATPNIQKTDVLRTLSSSFEEISKRSGRAVVQIFARSYVPVRESDRSSALIATQNSSGSGIIMTPDGYILTNAHVVQGAHTLKVQLNVRTEAEAREQGNGSVNRPLPATVIGVDRESDLAVIKIQEENLPYLVFGDSDLLRQGEIVLALGNPLGLDNSVSMGVVSAVARQINPDDMMVYIQTDAPINPGNSGGPLVDSDGKIVGVNTLILTQSGGSEGIGFAIPSNIARDVYAQLRRQGHVHRSQLGLVAETITPGMAEGLDLQIDHGVLVSDVEPDGPAERAGIKPDDIVTGFNGRRIDSRQQLEANVYRLQPGTHVTLRVQRGANQVDMPVTTQEEPGQELDTLADMVDPANNVVRKLGIVGLDLTKPVLELLPNLRRPAGVVVAARTASAPYSGQPLEVGDVIYSVNRRVINNVAELRRALAGIKAGDTAVLLLEREGHLIYVPLELD